MTDDSLESRPTADGELRKETQTRVCTKCHVEKDTGLFYRNRSKPGGLTPICKECFNIMRLKRLTIVRRSYIEHFAGNRELAIQRDGEKCVNCGITRAEHREKYGFDITVDHIDGKGRYTPKDQQNHDLSNLQTLCLSCHGRKDGAKSNLDAEDVRDIRMFGAFGMTPRQIQKCYQTFSLAVITNVLQRQTWKGEEYEFNGAK
jgi:cytochrome c553